MAGAGGVAAAQIAQELITRFTAEDNLSDKLVEIAKQASGLGPLLEGLTRATNLVSFAWSQLNGPLNTAINLGRQMEETTTRMAGSLRSYNVIGHTADELNRMADAGERVAATQSSMRQAVQLSQQIMTQMQQDAAALPGDVQDYITSYTNALPQALATTRRSAAEIARLSNQVTAAAIVNNIDPTQAGMDLMRMFSGMAQMDVRTWREVIMPMATDPRDRTGRRRLRSGQQFNALTGEQRFQVIQQAMERYAPMINAFATTWTAAIGTFESSIANVRRAFSGSVFEEVKQVLLTINDSFSRLEGWIVRVGRLFSEWFAAPIRLARDVIADIGNRLRLFVFGSGLTDLLRSPAIRMLGNALSNVGRFGRDLLFARAPQYKPSWWNGREVMARQRDEYASIQAQRRGIGALVGGTQGLGLFELLTSPEGFSKAVMAAARVINGFVNAVEGFLTRLGVIQTGQGPQNFLNAFERFAGFFERTAWPLGVMLADVLAQMKDKFIEMFAPLNEMMNGFTQHTTGENGVLAAAYRIAAVFLGLVSIGTWFGQKLVWLGVKVMELAAFFGDTSARAALDSAHNARNFGAGGRILDPEGDGPKFLEDLLNTLNMPTPGEDIHERTDRRLQQQHPTTHQDFRYSRFDITQKFAEGFDPDRIAAVFASDLAALSEQRLDTGFAPAFSTQ